MIVEVHVMTCDLRSWCEMIRDRLGTDESLIMPRDCVLSCVETSKDAERRWEDDGGAVRDE